MDELRVQENHLYDPTHSPQIRKIEGSNEWLISDLAAHLFLEKIPRATDRLLDCCFLLHQGKPSVLQATKHLMYRNFNVFEGMISTYQYTS